MTDYLYGKRDEILNDLDRAQERVKQLNKGYLDILKRIQKAEEGLEEKTRIRRGCFEDPLMVRVMFDGKPKTFNVLELRDDYCRISATIIPTPELMLFNPDDVIDVNGIPFKPRAHEG